MRRIDSRITHRRPELSQHYLRSPAIARSIVRKLDGAPGALVVEPGAGDGFITAELCGAGFRVIAIEKDERLYSALRARFAREPNVTCVHADFLELRLPSEPYRVVSNVPFGITAAVMRKLLRAARPPDLALLIVQREAAEKFAGTPQETLFSLLQKPRFDVRIDGVIARREFSPPPRVQSALLRVERRPAPLVTARDVQRYERLIESAFKYGLRRALRLQLTSRQIARLARDHRFSPDSRASQLNFNQWLAVFRFVEHECLGHDPTRLRRGGCGRRDAGSGIALQKHLLRRAGWLAAEVVDEPALEAA